MTLPRTVADVLAEHVVFEVECIDRMYLNVHVPNLQYPVLTDTSDDDDGDTLRDDVEWAEDDVGWRGGSSWCRGRGHAVGAFRAWLRCGFAVSGRIAA
jgi:hypothetical protein